MCMHGHVCAYVCMPTHRQINQYLARLVTSKEGDWVLHAEHWGRRRFFSGSPLCTFCIWGHVLPESSELQSQDRPDPTA